MRLTRYVSFIEDADDSSRGPKRYVNRYEVHRQLTKVADSNRHRFNLTHLGTRLRLTCHFFNEEPDWGRADDWFHTLCGEMTPNILDTSAVTMGSKLRLSGEISSYLKKAPDGKDAKVKVRSEAGSQIALKLGRCGLAVETVFVTDRRKCKIVKALGTTEFDTTVYRYVAEATCLDVAAVDRLLEEGLGKEKYLGFGWVAILGYQPAICDTRQVLSHQSIL